MAGSVDSLRNARVTRGASFSNYGTGYPGTGGVVLVDPASGRRETVLKLPGFTRGWALVGQYAFVFAQVLRCLCLPAQGGLQALQGPVETREAGACFRRGHPDGDLEGGGSHASKHVTALKHEGARRA